MEIIKGTIKREVASIELKDYEAANIIINSLINKGYDVISKPIRDSYQTVIGEQITIYKIEQR